jgi:hypothetical protein
MLILSDSYSAYDAKKFDCQNCKCRLSKDIDPKSKEIMGIGLRYLDILIHVSPIDNKLIVMPNLHISKLIENRCDENPLLEILLKDFNYDFLTIKEFCNKIKNLPYDFI